MLLSLKMSKKRDKQNKSESEEVNRLLSSMLVGRAASGIEQSTGLVFVLSGPALLEQHMEWILYLTTESVIDKHYAFIV